MTLDNVTLPALQPLLPSRNENSRALQFILAIMAFLAALALLYMLSALRLSETWRQDLQSSATVQLILDGEDMRETKIDAALDVLRPALPDAKVTAIEPSESRRLLEPWLGNLDLPDDLPLPALISIELEKGGALNAAQITNTLTEAGLIAEVDDHSRWSDKIGKSRQRLKFVAFTILSIIFAAGIAVSGFAAQAALSAQATIIKVLVQVGATDSYIARLFVGEAGWRGLKGAIIGALLATLTAILISWRWSADDVSLLADLNPHLSDGLWLIGLTFLFALACAIAAGLAVFRQLGRQRRA